jgi:hypothetical protein
MVGAMQLERKMTFGRSTCGAGNARVEQVSFYNYCAAQENTRLMRFIRMNAGVFTKPRSECMTGCVRRRLLTPTDYVTLRQQLHSTFVTPGVINITAVSTAGREQRQPEVQRMVKSRGLHAHVH